MESKQSFIIPPVHGGSDTWTTFSVRRAERVVYNLKRYRLLACQTAYPVIILHFPLPETTLCERNWILLCGHVWSFGVRPRNIAVWLLNREQNQHIHAGSKGTINSCFFCHVDESRYVLSALQRRVGVLWALLQPPRKRGQITLMKSLNCWWRNWASRCWRPAQPERIATLQRPFWYRYRFHTISQNYAQSAKIQHQNRRIFRWRILRKLLSKLWKGENPWNFHTCELIEPRTELTISMPVVKKIKQELKKKTW